jgi:outer membrane protein
MTMGGRTSRRSVLGMLVPGSMVFGAWGLCCTPAQAQDAARRPQPSPGILAIQNSGRGTLELLPASAGRVIVHDNAVRLSLFDAIALAIQNNLEVQVSRYQLAVADTDVARASGGGAIRGLNYSIFEAPIGVGSALSPLLPNAATSVVPGTPPVSEVIGINQMIETAAPWTIHTAPFSPGPNIPALDPAVIGQTGWYRRANTFPIVLYPPPSGPPTLQNFDFAAVNLAYVQGFSSGTQVQISTSNASRAVFGSRSAANPFSDANISFTVTQPLLRGRSKDVNLRFLKIASVNQKLSKLLFYQQLISTVYGVARLYADFISLNENVQVKRETLVAARTLHGTQLLQVRYGRAAPVEVTRANAVVSSSELDLIQAEGLVAQQEIILKSLLARNGEADRAWNDLPIVLTDRIAIPATDRLKPVSELVEQALAARPDLAMAALQVEAAELAVKAARHATLPELDVVANYQTGAQAQAFFQGLGTPGTGFIPPPPDLAMAGLIPAKTFHVGVQFNLPLRRRVARADAARDALQLSQAQARMQKLANDISQEVKSAVIALRTARSALEAAAQSRRYQEQLLTAEREKLVVGASTQFVAVQQQGYVAQARSTEAAARSTWMKAVIGLQRAMGTLLSEQGVILEDTVPADSLPGSLSR